MHRQEGQALTLALIALAVGALMVGPLLSQASTGLLASEALSPQLTWGYSCEAGVQHGIWRLRYEPGFASSITELNPTQSYTITINEVEVLVTVTWVEVTAPPPPPPPPPRKALRGGG